MDSVDDPNAICNRILEFLETKLGANGVAKGVLSIDANLGLYVNTIFGAEKPSTGLLLLGGAGFGLQVFADLSAYTEIARGASRLMGLELVTNFREPFLSRNPSDFWLRWHTSLCRWVRDYIYTPLVIYLRFLSPRWRYAAAVLFASVVMGLWHGADLRWLVWGLFFACTLMAHKLLLAPLIGGIWRETPFTRGLAVLATMATVCVGFLLARAPTLPAAFSAFSGEACRRTGPDLALLGCLALTFLFYSLPMMAAYFWKWYRARYDLKPDQIFGLRVLFYTLAALIIIVFGGTNPGEFIYFQF